MKAPDLWDLPERAISAFEKQNGLRITVHEMEGPLGLFLPAERFRHASPCCAGIKARLDWACVDFEVTRLRRDILEVPEGRYHCCHAGFMEWVLPVVLQNRLAWILFAGQARPQGNYQHLARDIRRNEGGQGGFSRLPAVAEPEADVILESLRQLRARLVEWREQIHRTLPSKPGTSSGFTERRFQIQNFLFRHHRAPAPVRALARELRLSESRTTHLVRELFGCSTIQLVNRLRLRSAASLLRASSLSILEVCLDSGFQDLSHFHRAFKKEFGSSPARYRREARA